MTRDIFKAEAYRIRSDMDEDQPEPRISDGADLVARAINERQRDHGDKPPRFTGAVRSCRRTTTKQVKTNFFLFKK